MSTRNKILILSVACGIAVIFSIQFPREPTYQGLRLSQWLELQETHNLRQIYFLQTRVSGTPVDPREQGAKDAIQQIGSEAVPCLLKWINAQPNSWKSALAKKIRGKPGAPRIWMADKIVLWLDPSRDLKLRVKAINGFRALGPAAVPAIPKLEKIACNPKAPGAEFAASILIHLKGVPALTSVLNINNSAAQRIRVLKGLGWLANSNPSALPAIIIYTKNSQTEVAAAAVTALGKIRPHSELTVPALIDALDDPRYVIRLNAVKGLGLYGNEAKSAVSRLERLTNNPDLAISDAAAESLHNISDWQPRFQPPKTSSNPFEERDFRLPR